MEEEDRISELADAILLHILSSIDSKQAVQTSILSKRWRHLWSTMPDLTFNFTSMAVHTGIHPYKPFECEAFVPTFSHFITQFLSHRDHTSTIHKLYLSGSELVDVDPRSVEKCVDYAVGRGVQHLDLEFLSYTKPFELPQSFFGCETLRELRLKQSCRHSMVVPNPFVLPNLKSLHLESFIFKDDDDVFYFPIEPFSGFPNLERLTLRRCGVTHLLICCPKLKILEIFFEDAFLYSCEPKIDQISTPQLTIFRYEGHFPLECAKVDFTSLEEVCLNIFTNFRPYFYPDEKDFLNCVKMLQQLGNAKIVTLNMDIIQVLEHDPKFLERSSSPFPYIKCLNLNSPTPLSSYKERLTLRNKVIPQMRIVLENVMLFLTNGCLYGDSVVVNLPQGVSVVQNRIFDVSSDQDDDEEDDDFVLNISSTNPAMMNLD